MDVRSVRVGRKTVDDSEVEQTERSRLRCAVRAALERGDDYLDERSLLGQALDTSGPILDLGGPFRMRDDGRQPTLYEQRHGVLKSRPTAVRAFDEEIAASLAEREPKEVLWLKLPQGCNVDLTSGEESQRNLAALELGPDDSETAFHLLGARRVVRAHVRGGRDRHDALARRHLRELDCLVECADAIVYCGQNVAVEVDHGPHNTTTMPRSVLHVSQPVEGGVPNLVLDLAGDQAERGWRVAVAAPAELAAAVRSRDAEAVEWRAGRNPNAATIHESAALGRLIHAVDPDLVHLHSAKAGLAGRLALRGRRPTVFQPHAWSFEAVGGLVGAAALTWERLASRWAHAVVCVSESERERGGRVGVRANYRVIPIGLDLATWSIAGKQERRRARKRLGLDDGPLAVCVGRLSRQKGQDLLVDAWPRVAERVTGARLVLVGEGPDYHQLAARAPSSVQLVGPRNDAREWIIAADVVVVASRWEGLSYVMLEALATGRSIASTDVGGAREALGDEAGAIVPVDDGAALLDAVAERLLDPERARAEGEAGRRRAERLYGFERTANQVAELYDELLGAG
jgi:glycosyltransferase involved in cell wall biosynthesis